jgi:hypothetical protein
MEDKKPIETSMDETRITVAGVMRCCLASVATEYEGTMVCEGMTSKCKHCGEAFTLIRDGEHYVWTPDWQKEG